MPLTISNSDHVSLRSGYSGPCDGRTSSTYYLTVKTVQSNEVQHRSKPLLLKASQTNSAKQFTIERHETVLSYDGIPVGNKGSYVCGVGGAFYASAEIPFFGITIPSVPTNLNWQLDARLKIMSEHVNLGSTLIEFDETAKMFHKLFKTLFFKFKRYLKGLPKKQRNKVTLDTLSGSILYYNFGIAPLVDDLIEAYFSLAARLELPIYRRLYVKKVFSLDDVFESESFSTTIGTFSQVTKGMVEQKVGIDLLMEPRPVVISGITINNMPALLWERVAFSFILDQIIPIGQTLQSLDAMHYVKEAYVSETTRVKYDISAKPNLNGTGTYRYTGAGGASSYAYKSHERKILTQIPLPRIPTYKPSSSLKAVMNDLAVLHVIRKR